ncbi:MAG: hypothetical protein KJ964_01285 [Verrucomicrobia bacterium]|nr:hypothetical protein [Verrucomicrobiota bacterium]MBU1734935.1 hypothetical protein [Verrucomicrobiota bacterium]MBU1857896.1 hypothetical protein [Verrucomicrobiota bacterium]
MKFAFYKKCITPKVGTGLAGYTRKPTSTGIYDDLYLQMLLMEDDQRRRLLLISADLIGFDELFVRKLRRWITLQDPAIKPENVNFSVTHTHCGPCTVHFVRSVGTLNTEYLRFLEGAIHAGVGHLVHSLGTGSLYYGKGRCALAVNRRRPATRTVDGRRIVQYEMRPNLQGSVDHELGVLCIRNRSEEIVVLNCACHPTTRGGYNISGDYPAAAMRALRSDSYAKREVMFLQGAGADSRVPCMTDDCLSFRPGTADDVIAYGNIVADAARRILKKGLVKIQPGFSAARLVFKLPYDTGWVVDVPRKDKEYWELVKWRKTHFGLSGVPMEWVIWRLGNNCVMMSLPGEVCHGIGLMAKKMMNVKYPFFLGYTNGLPTYIPTDAIIREGGYEGLEALNPYGQPYPFKAGVDNILKGTLQKTFSLLGT